MREGLICLGRNAGACPAGPVPLWSGDCFRVVLGMMACAAGSASAASPAPAGALTAEISTLWLFGGSVLLLWLCAPRFLGVGLVLRETGMRQMTTVGGRVAVRVNLCVSRVLTTSLE